MDLKEIEERQNKLSYWLEASSPSMEEIRELLSEMGDPERRLSKVAGPSCSPRDMQTLKESLAAGLHITSLCSHFKFPQKSVLVVDSLIKKIESQIVEEAPVSVAKGSYIQKNVDPTLDEYIDLAENAGQKLKAMEESEREKYGIPSLKIRYNNVFGYYIEVTNTHASKVPDHYQRKQTLTNSERYTTEELKELERKILSAKSKKEDLELEIFKSLKSEIVENTAHILAMVDFWSDIDVCSALAHLAKERSYCKPTLREDSSVDLVASKHPVLEMELGALFVENDIKLERESGILITGPNMAGKSTVMRQLASLAIMAQIGSFVPAKSASLPVFDQIFTRIGASDSLSEGLSTFMVEMTETAEIVNSATKRSLVILDEIGRGTSTYDGMSLAKAILEYLLEKSKAMILFSTHYHELTTMVSEFNQLENFHMAIRDDGKNIEFKHRFMKGSANKSYGIHVAKLAGLPASITKRAEKIQKEMELQNNGQMSLMAFATAEEESEDDFTQDLVEHNELIDELRDLRIQEMTPIDLMNRIVEWQNRLS
jgi:DNA mismatch repair protein MutS